MDEPRDDVIRPGRIVLGGAKLVSTMDTYIHRSRIFMYYRILTAFYRKQLVFRFGRQSRRISIIVRFHIVRD